MKKILTVLLVAALLASALSLQIFALDVTDSIGIWTAFDRGGKARDFCNAMVLGNEETAYVVALSDKIDRDNTFKYYCPYADAVIDLGLYSSRVVTDNVSLGMFKLDSRVSVVFTPISRKSASYTGKAYLVSVDMGSFLRVRSAGELQNQRHIATISVARNDGDTLYLENVPGGVPLGAAILSDKNEFIGFYFGETNRQHTGVTANQLFGVFPLLKDFRADAPQSTQPASKAASTAPATKAASASSTKPGESAPATKPGESAPATRPGASVSEREQSGASSETETESVTHTTTTTKKVTTTTTTATTTKAADDGTETSSSSGTIVWLILAALLLICGAAAFLLIRRRKNQTEEMQTVADDAYGYDGDPMQQDRYFSSAAQAENRAFDGEEAEPTVALNAESESQEPIRLLGRGGYFSGQAIEQNGEIIIGRHPQRCTLCYPIDERGISSVHCRLQMADGTLTITDLGSSYGTFVNGDPLAQNTPLVLQNGDAFWLADPTNTFIVVS